jgi:putative addiction module component (TIGR02574 family)
MSPKVATVLAAAEELSVTQRRELIELLVAGLDDTSQAEAKAVTPALTEAWRQEIVRRSSEYDAGQAETVTWQEVKARWQARRAAGG